MSSESPFEGFSKLSRQERRERLLEHTSLSAEDLDTLADAGALSLGQAEHLIENVIGAYALPMGVAPGFLIDGRDVVVPLVVEETSIVAAVSAMAKWVRRNGGFTTRALGHLIIGQVQFPRVSNVDAFIMAFDRHEVELLRLANSVVPGLVSRGGGVTGFQVRTLERPDGGTMVVVHILANPCDAMGANLINQVAEALKPTLEEISGERVGLCILSNLVDTKLVEATCVIRDIDAELGQAIQEATLFAQLDPYRRATHIKGIMNGIDPVLIATGNDWRAVEAGIHTYASLPGTPKAITSWEYRDGALHGRFLAPLAVGTVGGVTKIHPSAQIALKLMGVGHAEDLARICAATGLAQNLGALRALCSEGIIKGHMRLHASNFALMAGADKNEFPILEERLKSESRISLSRAQELLAEMRANTGKAAASHAAPPAERPVATL